MSSANKPKRIAKSSVNTPVTVEILGSKSITKEDAERFLTQFIGDEEERSQKNLASTTQVNSNTVGSISQLKRIQRDLRGLPPLESSITSSTTTPQPENSKKHKIFDDEPQPVAEKKQQLESEDEDAMDIDEEEVEEEEEAESPVKEEELSKEEKKQLKKEKKEKKEKKKKEKKEKK